MRAPHVTPCQPQHLPAVADLLARTRRARRAAFPLLPAGLDDAAAARTIIEKQTEGFVALDETGRVSGFLFPRRQPDPDWFKLRGDSVALAADEWALGPEAPAGTLARLYATSFAPLTDGIDQHIVLCPAHDGRLLDEWFHLGFGMEQAYGAVPLREMDTGHAGAAPVEIRRARPGDEEILVSLSHLIAVAQAQAPVWATAPEPYLASLREGFAGLTEEADAIVLLAFRDGRAVGYQAWFPAEADPVDGVTEGAVELGVGATVPEERGRGIGLALTAAGAAEALAEGYSAAFADWRTTNPPAAAFWWARGFEPFLYRLVRRFLPGATQASPGRPGPP